MGRMCGIATLTRRYVDAVAGDQRADRRYAQDDARTAEPSRNMPCAAAAVTTIASVLFDAVLIKDNHIVAAGGIAAAIKAARGAAGHMTKIEVEVDTLDQLEVVMREKIDCVLLDNMEPAELARAVEIVAGRCLTEASGGVNLDTVREIAETRRRSDFGRRADAFGVRSRSRAGFCHAAKKSAAMQA